jgi:aldose 1-epimerase
MNDSSLVELRAGRLNLLISPRAGGSIACFDWLSDGHRVPILRGSHSVPENILDAASFPLVPFVNRVRDGRFTFRGREIRLTPNMPGDPSPLHGQGWLSPWEVLSSSPAETELRFLHQPDEWPWAYEARQLFRLDEQGLSVDLTCRNLANEPMPCGLGQHPYFPCTAETRLDTQVTHAWTIDGDVLPVEKVSAAGRYDLADRLVCAQDLDHGFGNWGGRAEISDPALPFDIVMSSPDAHYFQLYSPSEGGLFVAEPVSHANAAMNASEADWPELGFQVLEPGDEMRLTMRLDILSRAS